MPKRRKVSNVLALAILSTLSMRAMHPYEMASIMRARGKDEDMPIKWGSLYTVVQNMEKHGLIRATGSVRRGGRPERTVYEITDDGRNELVDWVRELLVEPVREQPRFEAGLSVIGALGPDEVIDLLGQRLAKLDKQLAERRVELAEAPVPRVFLIEAEYDLAIRQAEADWVRGTLKEFTDGTFPGLDMWRTFHETGEIPPEIAELAERGSAEND
jgi:DNA-binding PadR family transcriptional regulator